MVMVILMSILIEEWRQKMKWTEFDMNSNLIVIIRTVSIESMLCLLTDDEFSDWEKECSFYILSLLFKQSLQFALPPIPRSALELRDECSVQRSPKKYNINKIWKGAQGNIPGIFIGTIKWVSLSSFTIQVLSIDF